jgi:hypothetical protein
MQRLRGLPGVNEHVDELGTLHDGHCANLRSLRVERHAAVRLFLGAHPDVADRLHVAIVN